MNLFNLFRHPKDLVDLSVEQLKEKIRGFASGENGSNVKVIDVRTPLEFQNRHLPGALSFPLGQEQRIAREIDDEQALILICKTGHRSQAAAAELFKLGFQDISHLKGGMDAWRHREKEKASGT